MDMYNLKMVSLTSRGDVTPNRIAFSRRGHTNIIMHPCDTETGLF